METNYKVNKVKIALTILVCLLFLGFAVFLHLRDPDASGFFQIINYITILVFFYYVVLFGLDLFKKNCGLTMDDKGILINYGYFKNTLLTWDRITGVKQDKRVILIIVDDPDHYLKKLPIITKALIYGYKNKFNTIFLLRGFLLNTKPEDLFKTLHEGFVTYKKEEDRE